MLTIEIPESSDLWDSAREEFVSQKGYTLKLEHSLISLQEWESRWHKPFLSSEKTNEELIDYIRCMTINKGIPNDAYYRIPISKINEITRYIENPMTATTITSRTPKKGGRKGEVITAEIIYYWMCSFNIPSEYRKWHLNQLLMLIRVFDAKNSKQEKMSPQEAAEWRRQQNAARRAKMHSKG